MGWVLVVSEKKIPAKKWSYLVHIIITFITSIVLP